MKRKLVLFMLLILTVALLSACGEETVDDVVESLNEKAQDMASFQAEANMTIETGEEPQQFGVSVLHKNEDYYKVVLQNKLDEKGNQVILRNDEGVFVLTPSINKSYKFQNEWPKDHSQPYLFNSLVDDINNDSDREFKVTENYYVFTVKTNYKGNQQLPYQDIYFHKSNYHPALVNVKNAEGRTVLEVEFTGFEFNVEIDDMEFDTEYNLAEGAISVPTMAELEEQTMTVYYPTFLPEGTEAATDQIIEFDEGERVITSFDGEKSFTLIQEMFYSYPTSMSVPVYAAGEMVDLGFTIGHLSNNTLEWQQNGMNFMLASETLTVEEMVSIAQSVQQDVLK